MRNLMRESQTIENLKCILKDQDLGSVITNGFFKNTLIYPNKKDAEIKKVCEHCGSKYTDQEASNKFKQAINDYQAEENRLYYLFRDSLFLNHNIEITDKGKVMFDIAWSRGHSSGLHEVYLCFEEMVEIL